MPLGTFDPAAVLDLIEKHRINITLGVPSMLAAMAEEQHANPRDTSSLQVLTHGGFSDCYRGNTASEFGVSVGADD